MSRSNRLFEIIQILRSSTTPITAEELAEKLEVSPRTIYRDIVSLQSMQTPIEGEAGIGYMMRRGYDLPPLNFDQEEIEALRVGLLLLSRTGDSMLQKAAERIFEKVDVLHGPADWLQVTSWGELRLTIQNWVACQFPCFGKPFAMSTNFRLATAMKRMT